MSAERQRRYMAKLRAGAKASVSDAALREELASVKAELATVKAELKAKPGTKSSVSDASDELTLVKNAEFRWVKPSKEAKLREQLAAVKAENAALKAQPGVAEVAKLRAEIETLKSERRSLKYTLRNVAKERDRYNIVRDSALLRLASRGKLERATYRKIVKCLHIASCPKARQPNPAVLWAQGAQPSRVRHPSKGAP